MERAPRYINLNRISMNQQTVYDFAAGKWVHLWEIPIEDVVNVIRCKDCFYFTNEDPTEETGFCEWWRSIMDYMGYCSCGEMKDVE